MDILKKLKNLKKKWRGEATKERKIACNFYDKECATESVGISIGFELDANDLDNLIRTMEEK